MKEMLLKEYELVKESRAVLLDYCDTVKPEHFIKEVPGFGSGGSMRSLLTHIANSYQHWTAVHCFKENRTRITPDSARIVADCRELYKEIDALVYRLIESYANNYDVKIAGITAGRPFEVNPFRVFMHITTHEYHHKGQILTISRILGYIPVDTDVIR